MYHVLMTTYPGYTVQRIDDELSMRQVRLLLACIEEHPPPRVTLLRVQKLLEKAHGLSFSKVRQVGQGATAASDTDVLDYLTENDLWSM